MSIIPDEIRGTPSDIDPAPVDLSDPGLSLTELARIAREERVAAEDFKARERAAMDQEERSKEESSRHDKAWTHHYDRNTEARMEIIRRVMESCGVDRVSENEWFYGNAPFAVAREGRTLFVVSPGERAQDPDSFDGRGLLNSCSLAIVEDPEPSDGLAPSVVSAPPAADPGVFDLARQALSARDGAIRSAEANDRARSEAERLEAEASEHQERSERLRLEAIRRVLESCGVGEVNIDDWADPLRPIAALRDGSTLLVVVPQRERQWPRGVAGPALAPLCSLVVVDDPRDEGATAPDPAPETEPDSARISPTSCPHPAHVPPPAPGILRDVVLRCIGWWESARTAAMDAHALPCPAVPRAEDRAFVEARQLAERTAREAEALLGTAILHLVGGRPPTFGAEDFALEALRPAAVEFGGIRYTVVADPHEAISNDDGPGMVTPIVARVESGRVVAIG